VIEISCQPSKEIIELLNNTEIGTPGKSITYRLSEVDKKIRFISSPLLLTLKKQSKLIATCCLCKRESRNSFESYYIRYFAISHEYRKGSGRIKNKKIHNSGLLKKKIESLLEGNHFKSFSPKDLHFFYAYIDTANRRSLALCNLFGFKLVRTFSTIVYSRYRPIVSTLVSKCQPHERSLIIEYLHEFYQYYSMFSTENLFYKDDYYVVKERNGNIVAGAQVNLVNWQITSIPGLLGKFLLSVLPHLPIINRYFKRGFKYVSIEAIFYKKGYENEIEKLFDSALAINHVHTALLWLDDKSDIYKTIENLKRGFFGSLFNFKPASIIVKTNGLSTLEQRKLKNSPAYISAFDLT